MFNSNHSLRGWKGFRTAAFNGIFTIMRPATYRVGSFKSRNQELLLGGGHIKETEVLGIEPSSD
jgi:hypothetical protein